MNIFKRRKAKNELISVTSFSYGSVVPKSTFIPAQSQQSQKSYPVYAIDALAGLASDKLVTTNKALSLESFYSCVLDQCGTIGSLPLRMYRSKLLDDRPVRVRSGQEFSVFCEQPNEYQTIQEFIEFIIVSYRTVGAFYALPFRDSRGRITEIIPFANQNSVVAGMDTNGKVYYTYTTNDGHSVGPIPGDQLFIVKNFTTNGYSPVRPLMMQAQLLNMATDQEKSYANLQSEGITSQMALSTDGLFDNKDARQRLKDDMNDFRGPSGKSEIPIFEQGLKPISLNLTPQELDLLKTREFSVQRVCAMNETMPHRIGAESINNSDKIYDLDEAQFKRWNPLVTKIERAFSNIAGRYISFTFDRKSFYAGSPTRLVEAVERELKGGMASVAEAREDLQRDFIPGTEDIFCTSSNNCTYGTWDELKQMNNNNDEGGNDE